jgi:lysozyme family protein
MADFQIAYEWMMNFEDRAREYAVVPDPGGSAISGINSAAWPEQYQIITNIPQSNPDRGTLVEAFYRQYIWNEWLAALDSDEVAKRVFDASVNMGSGTAVRLLQGAVNETFPGGGLIAEDGEFGTATVAGVNACGSDALVYDFQQARVAHYQAIVAANPADAKYLPAWTARAQA